MPYTLKVDWTPRRVSAVAEALQRSPGSQQVHAALRDLAWRAGNITPEDMDEASILTFNWPRPVMDAVCEALAAALSQLEAEALVARDGLGEQERSYEEIVSVQTQVHAALREIREYVGFNRASVPGYTG